MKDVNNDPVKWVEWLDESSDEDVVYAVSDSEEDVIHQTEHETDFEYNASEYEIVIQRDATRFYLGKDGITKWRKGKLPTNVRTRSCNITH